jgi:hypothetical protein
MTRANSLGESRHIFGRNYAHDAISAKDAICAHISLSDGVIHEGMQQFIHNVILTRPAHPQSRAGSSSDFVNGPERYRRLLATH